MSDLAKARRRYAAYLALEFLRQWKVDPGAPAARSEIAEILKLADQEDK